MSNKNNSVASVINDFFTGVEYNWRSRRNIILVGPYSSQASLTINEKEYYNNQEFIANNLDSFIEALYRVYLNSIDFKLLASIKPHMDSVEEFRNYFMAKPMDCLSIMIEDGINGVNKDLLGGVCSFLDYFTISLVRHFDEILLFKKNSY